MFTVITITMTIIMIMIIIISITITKSTRPRQQDLYLGSSLDDGASLQFSLSLHLLLRIRSPFQYGALKPTNKQTSKHTYNKQNQLICPPAAYSITFLESLPSHLVLSVWSLRTNNKQTNQTNNNNYNNNNKQTNKILDKPKSAPIRTTM